MGEDSVPDDGQKETWWKTLPGILTGSAGLITAITGLLVGLNQLGVFPLRVIDPSPSPSISSVSDDSNPEEIVARPPDHSGTGVAPWFGIRDERVSISRVVDPNRRQSGVYFRNVGEKRIFVRFSGDCRQPSCHDSFFVSPISIRSQAAEGTTVGCAADGHLVFDTMDEFDFHWDIWVTSATTAVSGC